MPEIRLMPEKGYELHVTDKDGHGDPDSRWSVWLNTEVSDFDGLIIGQGDTPQAAMADAKATLAKMVALL